MDEEELYSQLNNRIREVFDDYEDTTVDEGWALLRQKFPEEEKRRGLAWLWYAAAAIVLLCLGVWFINKPDIDKNLTVKTPKTIIHSDEKDNSIIDTNKVQDKPATDHLAQANPPATNAAAITPSATALASVPKPGKQTNTTKQPATYLQPQNALAPLTKVPQAKQPVNSQMQAIAKNNPINSPRLTVPAVKNGSQDSIINKINKGDVLANNPPRVKPVDTIGHQADQYAAANKPADAQKQTTADALNKLLSEKTAANALNDKQTKKAGKKTVLSVFAATYFNYAKGSDNNINVGAGFGSDFRISNKLKLSTGLSIAQNSLNYANGMITTNSGNANATASADPASAALNQVVYNSSAGKFGASSALIPVLKNYTASLVGLDVPINLKYQFNPRKNDTYVSAGLSSGTFINETYVLNYTSAQLEQKSTTHASFNNFDFAKTLNVSFGVGYPLGKRNRLIVEPFLKYPLNGLGSQQIKFGAGGVNLKLNFIPTKK